MCVVSAISDDWSRRVPPQYPWVYPTPTPSDIPSREEFEALRAEVVALKALLEAAKVYDKTTGQPDCETADKVAMLKWIASLVGVDLADVLDAN